MDNMFLISLDNGAFYDDHHVSPLCTIPTKACAEAEIAAWNAWALKQRERMPPPYVTPEGVDDGTDVSGYDAYVKVQQAFLDSLKPPHGLNHLVSLVTWEYEKPYLTITQLPCLK